MPKMKRKSSAKKRFKLTGTGKVKRAHAFKRHNLSKRSKKAKKALSHSAILKKTEESRVKRMLSAA